MRMPDSGQKAEEAFAAILKAYSDTFCNYMGFLSHQ